MSNISPERRLVLESVAAVRNGVQPHRHLAWARHSMRIPEWDFYALVRLYPGLIAQDPAEKTAAWEEFEKSPLSEPYRVGKTVRGVIKNGLIIP